MLEALGQRVVGALCHCNAIDEVHVTPVVGLGRLHRVVLESKQCLEQHLDGPADTEWRTVALGGIPSLNEQNKKGRIGKKQEGREQIAQQLFQQNHRLTTHEPIQSQLAKAHEQRRDQLYSNTNYPTITEDSNTQHLPLLG